MNAKELAKFMHDQYERIAKEEGWTTQESCKVAFDDLPEKNRKVMLRVAQMTFQFIQDKRDWQLRVIHNQWLNLSFAQKQFMTFMARNFATDDLLHVMVSYPIRKDGLLHKRRIHRLKFLPNQRTIPEEGYLQVIKKLGDYFAAIGCELTLGEEEYVPLILKNYLDDFYIWRDMDK